MSKSTNKKKVFPDLREKAEQKLLHETKISEEKHPLDVEHELDVHRIELQMQNEELLATQLKLVLSLREYENLFEFSPVGYFILDKNGIIEKVNATGSGLLGYEKAHLVGKPFSTFLHGEYHQDNFYRHRNSVVETKKLHHFECDIMRSNGAVFSALLKSTFVTDEALNFKHLLSIVSDISEIKAYERQIELSLKKARDLNELKSRFITMASHEFRTPLSAIQSSTWLAEQYALKGEDEKFQKHLNRIRSSIQDLTAILDEFLSLEKIESGKVEINKKTFDLPQLCQDAIEEVHAIMKNGQSIQYKHSGAVIIHEDKNILHHILLNLLSNACKYSGENMVINLVSEVTDNTIFISVKDHGIGIPEDEQQNVFLRFFRAQNVMTTQGTGLGLNIVKRYIELLDGTIAFTSSAGEGTTFVVTLPLNP